MSALQANSSEYQLNIFLTQLIGQKELMAGIASLLKDVPIAGCSGQGVISSRGSIEELHAVSVMLFSGEKLKFNVMRAKGLKESSEKCGENIARQINEFSNFEKAKAAILLPDGLTVNCTQLIQSIEKNLKKPLMLSGGLLPT